ncbi:unnamed protein product [Toxocara canis]|uniref:Uncharacterized protein n=1 Tax=Toxocara canis TaxID=6265 RepID=A0A3P7H1J8_TOXCA|nr:unnamed protein product [Toxocara canis]
MEFAWRTLTGQLMSSNFADQSKPKRKSEDEILKRTSVKWKELREFIKVSFRARNPYIRELDKTELLLIQCKLFMQMNNSSLPPIEHLLESDPSISRLRKKLLTGFEYDDMDIYLENLRDEREVRCTVEICIAKEIRNFPTIIAYIYNRFL